METIETLSQLESKYEGIESAMSDLKKHLKKNASHFEIDELEKHLRYKYDEKYSSLRIYIRNMAVQVFSVVKDDFDELRWAVMENTCGSLDNCYHEALYYAYKLIERNIITPSEAKNLIPLEIAQTAIEMVREDGEPIDSYIFRIKNNSDMTKVIVAETEAMKYSSEGFFLGDNRMSEEDANHLIRVLGTYLISTLSNYIKERDYSQVDPATIFNGLYIHRALGLVSAVNPDMMARAASTMEVLLLVGYSGTGTLYDDSYSGRAAYRERTSIDAIAISSVLYYAAGRGKNELIALKDMFEPEVLGILGELPPLGDLSYAERRKYEFDEFILARGSKDYVILIMMAVYISDLRSFVEAEKAGDNSAFKSDEERMDVNSFYSWTGRLFDDFVEEHSDNQRLIGAYWELNELYKELFDTYYFDPIRSVVYQVNDFYCYMLAKGIGMDYIEMESFDPVDNNLKTITRKEAYDIQDEWVNNYKERGLVKSESNGLGRWRWNYPKMNAVMVSEIIKQHLEYKGYSYSVADDGFTYQYNRKLDSGGKYLKSICVTVEIGEKSVSIRYEVMDVDVEPGLEVDAFRLLNMMNQELKKDKLFVSDAGRITIEKTLDTENRILTELEDQSGGTDEYVLTPFDEAFKDLEDDLLYCWIPIYSVVVKNHSPADAIEGWLK